MSLNLFYLMTPEVKEMLAKHIAKKKRKPGEFGCFKSRKELIELATSDAVQVENHLALHLKDMLNQIGKLGEFWSTDDHDYAGQARVLFIFLCTRWRIVPVRKYVH